MPQVSQTEKEALEAGKIWWDNEIWKGTPDWQTILSYPQQDLTDEEQQFLDGPVEELCTMLDDWEITHNLQDLPAEAWDFIRNNKFFGIIIPKAYDGLGFSATAHSAIIQKIASKSIPAAVTVMVPNSIGPGELLAHHGTNDQKDYYLPRLAQGKEIPCFGLTGPDAGSDASSTPDFGTVCHGIYQGKETLGIRLNWHKRYITLAPIATLIGLAFKLYDPDQLLGSKKELGITFAIIPRSTDGISVGTRHFPLNCPFQNGPIWGKDVFIPLDMIIGGEAGVGKGWSMLMEALAAGRGISLPALSVGGAKLSSRTMGAYTAARKQFNLPLFRFDGVAEALARIGGNTYLMESARKATLQGIDNGERPAVVTAIVKYHLTELLRSIINDAMDVHGGAGICLGPQNILGRIYQSAPIGITVEGANILTRSFIVFNQSLLRSHPYIHGEIEAIAQNDEQQFDKLLFAHIGFVLGNLGRSIYMGLGGQVVKINDGDPLIQQYAHQATRLASAFALTGDLLMLLLGAELKRKEKITGRMSDVIGNLFLTMTVLKHFSDGGNNPDDAPLAKWACQKTIYAAQENLLLVLNNFPVKSVGFLLKVLFFPAGRSFHPPDDRLDGQITDILTRASNTRDRLTEGIFIPSVSTAATTALLDAFLALAPATQEAEIIIKNGIKSKTLTAATTPEIIHEAQEKGLVSADQADQLLKLEEYRKQIIAVDDFSTLLPKVSQ